VWYDGENGKAMRIQVLNDLHLETGPKDIKATDADVVVLAGDIGVGASGLHWAREQFSGKPVVYVLGNHEFYHQSIPELTFELKKRCNNGNVHILENETFEFDGYTFLGCTLDGLPYLA
jgi:predicted phosphodiesterase